VKSSKKKNVSLYSQSLVFHLASHVWFAGAHIGLFSAVGQAATFALNAAFQAGSGVTSGLSRSGKTYSSWRPTGHCKEPTSQQSEKSWERWWIRMWMSVLKLEFVRKHSEKRKNTYKYRNKS